MEGDSIVTGGIIFVLVALFYFIPSFNASMRGHPQRTPITLLNLFLGWTVVGWIIAMIWSSTNWIAGQAWAVGGQTYEPVTCSSCGSPIGSARFCSNCGGAANS